MLPRIHEDLPEQFIKTYMGAVMLKELRNRAGMGGYDSIHSFNEISLLDRFCNAKLSFSERDQKEA